jgi:hypothetical protein
MGENLHRDWRAILDIDGAIDLSHSTGTDTLLDPVLAANHRVQGKCRHRSISWQFN